MPEIELPQLPKKDKKVKIKFLMRQEDGRIATVGEANSNKNYGKVYSISADCGEKKEIKYNEE